MYERDKNYLILISEAIIKIESYTKGFNNPSGFAEDVKSFDASLMNFIVIAECVNRLGESFKDKHPEIEWKKLYAFRNIIAHDYFGIDEEEVWDIITFHLPSLKENILILIKQESLEL